MTKKDYDKIAKALKMAKPVGTDNAHYEQWRFDCLLIAAELERENNLFKEDLFLKACGL